MSVLTICRHFNGEHSLHVLLAVPIINKILEYIIIVYKGFMHFLTAIQLRITVSHIAPDIVFSI